MTNPQADTFTDAETMTRSRAINLLELLAPILRSISRGGTTWPLRSWGAAGIFLACLLVYLTTGARWALVDLSFYLLLLWCYAAPSIIRRVRFAQVAELSRRLHTTVIDLLGKHADTRTVSAIVDDVQKADERTRHAGAMTLFAALFLSVTFVEGGSLLALVAWAALLGVFAYGYYRAWQDLLRASMDIVPLLRDDALTAPMHARRASGLPR